MIVVSLTVLSMSSMIEKIKQEIYQPMFIPRSYRYTPQDLQIYAQDTESEVWGSLTKRRKIIQMTHSLLIIKLTFTHIN